VKSWPGLKIDINVVIASDRATAGARQSHDIDTRLLVVSAYQAGISHPKGGGKFIVPVNEGEQTMSNETLCLFQKHVKKTLIVWP
jgi:hypothetical protein